MYVCMYVCIIYFIFQQAEKKEPSKESVPLSTYFKIIHDIELMHTKVSNMILSITIDCHFELVCA